MKPYSWCISCGPSHLSWFQGLKYSAPSSWPRVYKCVHDIKTFRRKPKRWRSFGFGYVELVGQTLENPPDASDMETFVKFFIDVSWLVWIVEPIWKQDVVAPLIAYPPDAKSTTIHSRVVCQDQNLCPSKPAYLPSPAKPP